MSLEAHVVTALSHDSQWSTVHATGTGLVVKRHETHDCALAHVKQAGGIVLPPSKNVECRKEKNVTNRFVVLLGVRSGDGSVPLRREAVA